MVLSQSGDRPLSCRVGSFLPLRDEELLKLSAPQLKVWREIKEIDRAWFLLRWLMSIVSILTTALVVALFLGKGFASTGISGLLDGIFGVCLLKITDYHYPNKISVKRIKSVFQTKKYGVGPAEE